MTERFHPHIAARVFNTPLLIEQNKLNAILGVLGKAWDLEVSATAEVVVAHTTPEAHWNALEQMAVGRALKVERMDEGYARIGDVAVVPVVGTLVQRGDWMSEASGMMSYGRIERAFSAAVADPQVREVLLEIDSPGGEVAGAFDLADRMVAAREEKTITAVATEYAASAAYLIASAAHEIVVPRTGFVGSVGVVAAHYDYSRQLEKRGVAVTLLYAGDKKVDGNPYEPLSDRAKAEWMGEISAIYQLFVDTVARNLNTAPGKVKATEAGMYMGFKAVETGMAHRVNTYANELSNAVLRQGGPLRSQSNTSRKEQDMEKKDADKTTLTAEDVSAARAAGDKEGHQRGLTEGATAERTRVKGILAHAEASERTELAQHLAFDTDMSVEAAGAMLAKAPKTAKGTALDRAMASQPSAKIPAEDPPAPQADKPKINPGAVYDKRRQAVAAVAARG